MSAKKNFIYNFSYQILIMILPLITTPYVSRVLGADGVGIQSYTYSIVSYFVLFTMLGINNYGNRSIAMARDDRTSLSKEFINIYLVQFMMAVIMIILYIIYIIFVVTDNKTIYIIQLIYILSAMLDINWFFFGMEKFKLTVVRNVIIKILSVFSIFIFVKDSKDIYIYSLILALSNLLGQVVLWKYIGKYVRVVSINIKEVVNNIKPILILFIPVIAISIYKIMDKIMLGATSNMDQVGFYENSERIINIPMGVIVALGTVMLPKMSNLYAKGKNNDIEKYISLSLDFIMFMAYGAMFGLIGISPILIPIFLGNDFSSCVEIVSLLSVTILFLAWANVIRTQFLIPRKKDKIYIISTILGAVVNLIINILLIKKYGAIGATIGTILAEVTVAIFQSIMIRKEINIIKYFSRTVFYIIPGSVMFIVIRVIGNSCGSSLVTTILQIILGGSIYCIISFIYLISIKNQVIMNIIYKIIKKN